MQKLRVIDFFCGAGGFSEGFRQMGYDVVYGYDHWKPAVDTFNYNFNLNCVPKNILEFKISTDKIEELPDTEIIIGSPPCVNFSSSNKSGNADKSLGVELTETFLRIIAIKKHQPNSILKAWFMENVVNSQKYLQNVYTFKDLGLSHWATKNKFSPMKIAIDLYTNTSIINSADYGSFQARKRVISGETINSNKLIIPDSTHSETGDHGKLVYQTLQIMKSNFPNPYSSKSETIISDPQYSIKIPKNKITDHFYDTGVYKVEWMYSKYWKTNHPFMGKMSFPEHEDKPSRTITATKTGHSRESIIYKSEIKRIGNGQYRLPTVREAATIMGFPITYQFLGSEYTKWRMVGNAVCCSVSRAFAKAVLESHNIKIPNTITLCKVSDYSSVLNLNTYKLKPFDKPPIKKKGSRFRRHSIKDGNLTVTLSNYNIEKNSQVNGKWFTSIQYGNGKGFPIQHIKNNYYKKIEILLESFDHGKEFISFINNGFSTKIASASLLQEMYENHISYNNYMEPTELVDEISRILKKVEMQDIIIKQSSFKVFKYKENIPLNQFLALYAINKISTIANGN